MAGSRSLERLVKNNAVSAAAARRFVAGETLEDTISPVRALNARGITASLDHLGENVTRPDEAREAAAYIQRMFGFIADNRLDANVSLKLTQLGLDIDDGLAAANLRQILKEAARYDQFVRIDMEGSAYTERTLDLFACLWPEFKNVGVVIQAYLYRSEADVARMVELGARVRLCKGAYDEPASVAFPEKSEVDANYVRLMKMLLAGGRYPAIATHDEAMIQATQAFAREKRIKPDQFEFQMLYGIRRERQVSLAQAGHRMRVYVPFGTQWYGYFFRRLAERPANLWFVMKNLFRH